ncbi:MAG: 50S ribosomal protein L21 [Patescibacteria group bacterium]
MKYAIIELAGRQFMVKEGDTLEVTRQSKLSCKTLFYKSEGETKVGTPYLENILVDLEKVEDKKDDKVVVARFKSKSRYRRKRGHRQPISVVKVKSIKEKK